VNVEAAEAGVGCRLALVCVERPQAFEDGGRVIDAHVGDALGAAFPNPIAQEVGRLPVIFRVVRVGHEMMERAPEAGEEVSRGPLVVGGHAGSIWEIPPLRLAKLKDDRQPGDRELVRALLLHLLQIGERILPETSISRGVRTFPH